MKQDGTFNLVSNKLGDCDNFPMNSNIKTVWLAKDGDDTWIGEAIEVVSGLGVDYCPVSGSLKKDGKRTFYCIHQKLLTKSKKIEKISVKTKDGVRYAGSADSFEGEVCGINDICCGFTIPKNSLVYSKAFGSMGEHLKLELVSDRLGGCQNFPIYPGVQSVTLKKIGDDTWTGDFIEVVTRKSSNQVEQMMCNVNTALRKNGQGTFPCSLCSAHSKLNLIYFKQNPKIFLSEITRIGIRTSYIKGSGTDDEPKLIICSKVSPKHCCSFIPNQDGPDLDNNNLNEYIKGDLQSCQHFLPQCGIGKVTFQGRGEDGWRGDFINIEQWPVLMTHCPIKYWVDDYWAYSPKCTTHSQKNCKFLFVTY